VKHFIVELTYCVPFEQLSALVPEHRTFLQAGYERGWLLMSGPQVPKTGGIIVARAPGLEDLQAYFCGDPFARHGVAVYRYVEFEPVRRQAGMEGWAAGEPLSAHAL